VSASEHEEAQTRLAALKLRDHDLSERIDSIETFIASVHETLNGTPTDTEMIIYVLSQQRGKMEEMVCSNLFRVLGSSLTCFRKGCSAHVKILLRLESYN